MVADNQGNWEVAVTTPLNTGTHSYTVSITDLAQNVSTPLNGSLDIQNGNMTGLVTGGLDIDSNTGDTGDTITSNKKPNFSGTAPAGVTVIVTISGKTYKTVADQHGNWKLAITSPLRDGDHDYSISLEDIAGNQSPPITGKITIDSESHLKINGLSDDTDSGAKADNITNNTTPTLTGTAEANATITLTIDGNRYTTTANGDGAWTIPLTHALTDGAYHYTVTATDSAGNTTSSTATVTIDTTAPDHLTGGLDTASETGAAGSHLTNQTTPTFSGVTESGATVTLMINGKTYTAVAGENGKWSITLPEEGKLADGSYPYTITVTDASGNTSGAQVNGNVTVQNTPPSANAGLHAGSDSGVTDDQITNNTQPTLSGKTAPGASIVVIYAGVNYPVPVDASGYWTFRVPATLTDGDYAYQVLATDNAGNESRYEGAFTIDTTPPDAPAAALAESADSGVKGDDITHIKNPTFTGTAEANATVILTINGKDYTAKAGSDGVWTITLPVSHSLPDGTYQYTVLAQDAAGNTSAPAAGSVIINTSAPAIPVGGPDDNITNVTTPTFSGTADPNITVILTLNGKRYDVPVNDDGTWRFTLPVEDKLNDGAYDFTLQGQNTAGTTSGAFTGSITIDTTPPDAAVGELTADTDTGITGDNITSVSTPTFTGTTEPDAIVILTINNKTYEIQADSSGVWRFTLPTENALPDDTYIYTVQAKDAAGNTSTPTSGSLTIDSTPPAPTDLALTDDSDTGIKGDNITSNKTPTFTGITEPGATIILTLNKKTYTFQAGDDGRWRFTLPAANTLDDGIYHYTVQAKDIAGNTSSLSTGWLTIDATPPALSLEDNSDTGTAGDNITSINTPTFTGSSEAHATITLNIDSKVFTTTADSAGKWTITLDQPINDGTYEYTLIAKDAAGNENTLNEQLTIDTQPPAEPTLGSTTNGLDSTVTLQGTVEANQDIQVKVTVNGTEYSASVDNDSGDWHVSVPQSAILSGENQYTITATDPAGNSATASGTFTGTSPTENPVNTNSCVDEMISLSEATLHSVSVEEEYYAL
ncbi:TPA: hypothetical protein JDC27_002109 [Salmonella enterica subsp. salamae]|nr:hypothetical protein [Salmonella enterica subsp. salamae]